ncbi:hypothetical protein B0T16DRAFT_453752 [Cercophora newfieldiana]|uniref:HNH nuclease domain-containing protein n=1 Tax=Cercophora newfieldiana TaxID=92897 RepID=A0AA39YG57_9PEZI|nr:hypothetical protein B0T16DRAFT_453752 [Cercophora newfieldiana]
MAGPSHRHQSSLEGILDFSEVDSIFENAQQRAQAISRFRRIIAYFENTTEPKPPASSSRFSEGYDRPALIRLTFDYVRSPESQDRVLKAFFKSLALGMLEDSDDNDGIDLGDDSEVASLRTPVFAFADHLIYHFFLPLQQVHSRDEQQRIQDFVGTPERLGALRGFCLTRDRHRCVITHTFDLNELLKRMHQQPSAQDDDGNVLDQRYDYDKLEVAHILPFSLNQVDESKKATIAILNMFDIGVIHVIEGPEMDRPRNAITLTNRMHDLFGRFKIFFEPAAEDDAVHHDTYQIQSFLPPFLATQFGFPVQRTLFSHPYIDPPLPRLLALHSAIAHILHLSGAGEYIDGILRDGEDGMVREDGSTQLGALVNMALQMST